MILRVSLNMVLLLTMTGIVFGGGNKKNREQLSLTEQGYLGSPEVSVLAYHNHYPVGFAGGIEVIHHDNRVMTNGMLNYKFKDAEEGQTLSQPIPIVDKPVRELNQKAQSIRVPFEFKNNDFSYDITIAPIENGAFNLTVNFDQPIEKSKFDTLSFSIELFPGLLKGKAFVSDMQGHGVFPHHYQGVIGENGQLSPLATGKQLTISPDDELTRMSISSKSGMLKLYDGRALDHRYWFTLVVDIPNNSSEKAVDLIIRPNSVEGWERKPVISYAQIGYHPEQAKEAIVEISKYDHLKGDVKLVRLSARGENETVLVNRPSEWGDFKRYKYFTFDFSHIKKEGVYRIEYGDVITSPFKISKDIYDSDTWGAVLGTFLPVQMCHMNVMDRTKLWHGKCHLDDAMQVPSPKPFFDGFNQPSISYSKYEEEVTIPKLNVGGWHDAADDDINTGSTGKTTYHLALMIDEFGLDFDQTTVDFSERKVRLHQPDGEHDAYQQMMHGLNWLLANYENSDHSYVGVISRDWNTYLQSGGWGHMTDNLLYDPKMEENVSDGTYSGKNDDRYVFTSKDSRREYLVASVFAASSRALRHYDTGLSKKVLDLAVKIWNTEESGEKVFNDNVGTPRNLQEQRIIAATELFLATDDHQYIDVLLKDRDTVSAEFNHVAWAVSRVVGEISDKDFLEMYRLRLYEYSAELKALAESNPFEVYFPDQIWGFNWDILWNIYPKYYLIKNHPDMFPKDYLFDAIHFTLGKHPISNVSHVSGVGANRPLPAYGMNRADYSYIPGGVFSGVGMVFPDFFELKEDHPFLWQQTEYIVFGATPFVFSVLAADKLLNKDQ